MAVDSELRLPVAVRRKPTRWLTSCSTRADRQHAAVLAGGELIGVHGDCPPTVEPGTT